MAAPIRDRVTGELGISPEVSEEMELEGEGGGRSSWKVVETGVLRSHDAAPVRRRLEGGRFDAEGEKPCLGSSRSDMSSEATDERGEPGDSAIGGKRQGGEGDERGRLRNKGRELGLEGLGCASVKR